LKRIEPLSTIPADGLCAVVPDGIVIAEVALTLATLPVAGESKILFPVVEVITPFVIVNLSLLLNEPVVFMTAELVIFPVDCKNWT